MVIVDSSVWIEAARQTGRLDCKVGLRNLIDSAQALVCGPVKLEVLGGARKEHRQRMSDYFKSLPYLPITDDAWNFALDCAWRLRDKGRVIPWNDILIGSLSIKLNCRVYSADKHFEMMRDIGVQLYTPGYGGSYQPEIED